MRGTRRTGRLLTRVELARALDVHVRTIAKWIDEGLPIAERGRAGRPSLFNEALVAAWVANRNARQAALTSDLDEARARRALAETVLLEQRHAVLEGKLLPFDEVVKAKASEASAVRAKLLAIPQTQADRIAKEAVKEGAEAVERILEELMLDALKELRAPDDLITSIARGRGRR